MSIRSFLGLHRLIGAAVATTSLLVACGGTDTSSLPSTGTPSASEDERGNIGVPPAAVAYCTELGYAIVGDDCKFPDGTTCEQWSFWRGTCGQAYSYCNQHGGAVSTKTEDAGTYTSVVAVCDLDGKQCEEASFAKTGTCE